LAVNIAKNVEGGTLSDYKELLVWQKSMGLAEKIYQLTKHFPREELFGLTSQVRRSAVSIAANIAEGSSRGGRKEFVQFLLIARGSASETETHILLASRIGYLPDVTPLIEEITSIRQMLNALIRSLKRTIEGAQ